jgi:hypothetical protein
VILITDNATQVAVRPLLLAAPGIRSRLCTLSCIGRNTRGRTGTSTRSRYSASAGVCRATRTGWPVRLSGCCLIRECRLELTIRRAGLETIEHPLQSLIGWKATINQATDYEQRNRKRSTRGSAFRQLADIGSIDALPQRLGARFDFIRGRFAARRIIERILRLLHSLRLLGDSLCYELRLDSLRRELQSSLLERPCG